MTPRTARAPSATQSASRFLRDAASAPPEKRPAYACPECATSMHSPNHTVCPNCALPLDPAIVRAAFGVNAGGGGKLWMLWVVLAAGAVAGLVAGLVAAFAQ